MKKKERVIEFWHIVVVILAILLFLLLKTSMTGKAWYRDYGSSFGGFGGFGGFDFFGLSFFSFTDLYASYGYIIDAVIFLMIFLGLAQSVFKERFKESRGLYVGMGLFLSFALLMWEERTGISLLEQFGPVVFVLFVLVVIFLGFRILHKELGFGWLTSFLVVWIVVYFIFVKTIFSETLLENIKYLLPELRNFYIRDLFSFLDLVSAVIVAAWVAASLYRWRKGKGG